MTSSSGRVVTLGETMGLLAATTVGHLPHVPTMALGIGGAESNVAIALTRLGVGVDWIGRLGVDSLGDKVVRELTAEGVGVRATRDPSAPTGLMLKERPPGGGTRVWYYRAHGAGARLCPADVDEDLVATAALLHVTGITPALGEGPAAAVRRAVAVARSCDVPVSVDVNYRSALWSAEDARPVLRALIADADIVFAGDDEARLVLGGDPGPPSEAARALTGLGPAEAVIKLGADGALGLVDGELHEQPAFPVTVVDPVGAGDAFVGAYLAERLAGADPATRLRTAARAGALMCTVPGDWEALPTRATLATTAEPADVVR
ncbi:sugar kinase [Amycolatopsis thermoflava]|uniref:sugar kinase n=1 Tax=Amycolatopsis thermoflava TaxID=84480 RepID=UPI0038276188